VFLHNCHSNKIAYKTHIHILNTKRWKWSIKIKNPQVKGYGWDLTGMHRKKTGEFPSMETRFSMVVSCELMAQDPMYNPKLIIYGGKRPNMTDFLANSESRIFIWFSWITSKGKMSKKKKHRISMSYCLKLWKFNIRTNLCGTIEREMALAAEKFNEVYLW
jgi:hypothetical protein